MYAMDIVPTSKELFLKLAAVRKQTKSLKTTLYGLFNEKYYINFLK